jgi:hypothetical protein
MRPLQGLPYLWSTERPERLLNNPRVKARLPAPTKGRKLGTPREQPLAGFQILFSDGQFSRHGPPRR